MKVFKRPEATAEAFRNGWFHTGDIGIGTTSYRRLCPHPRYDRAAAIHLPSRAGGSNLSTRWQSRRRRHRRPDGKTGERSQSVSRQNQGAEFRNEMIDGKGQFEAIKYRATSSSRERANRRTGKFETPLREETTSEK